MENSTIPKRRTVTVILFGIISIPLSYFLFQVLVSSKNTSIWYWILSFLSLSFFIISLLRTSYPSFKRASRTLFILSACVLFFMFLLSSMFLKLNFGQSIVAVATPALGVFGIAILVSWFFNKRVFNAIARSMFFAGLQIPGYKTS